MNAQRPTTVRYRVIAWLVAAAALSYLCRNVVSVAESSIRADLEWTKEQSAWFMGTFFLTYGLFQVPSGWFSEKIGARWALALFAVAWSLATCGIGLATAFPVLIAMQLLMGIAQAGIFPASCNAIGVWMPMSRRSLSCGAVAAGMQVGAIASSALAGALLVSSSWRWVFVWFALPGLVWAIGFAVRFRNTPGDDRHVNEAELETIRGGNKLQDRNALAGNAQALVGSLWLSPTLWFLCGQQIFRASGYMFFASWFPTFLQEARGVTVAHSGVLQGLVLAGTLLGSLLGGYITDWVWQRTGSLRASRSGVGGAALGACALLVLMAWFVANVNVAVGLLATGALCAACAGPCAFATAIDIAGPRVPSVFGVMNMTGNLAAMACPILVAKIVEETGNWELVLGLFAAVYALGAGCWCLLIVPTGARSQPRGAGGVDPPRAN